MCGAGLDDASIALSALVDQSLVVLETTATGRRYRLLDLVRAFAGARLDEAEGRGAMERTRAEWVDALAKETSGNLSSHPKWKLNFLDAQPDIEAALAWRASEDPAAFIDSVRLVGEVWHEVSRWTVAAAWVERALEAIDSDDAPHRLALLLLAAGLAFDRWEFREATRMGEEALEIAQQLNDRAAEETAHNLIGASTWRSGDLDRARHHNERSYDLGRTVPGLEATAATAANNLGLVALSRGDLDSAEAWFNALLDLHDPRLDRTRPITALHAIQLNRGDGGPRRAFSRQPESRRDRGGPANARR